MLGAVPDILGNLRFDFVALEVLGQRFVPPFALTANVAFDLDPRVLDRRVLDRRGQTVSGVGRLVITAQIQLQLVGIVEVAFAAPGEDALHPQGELRLHPLLVLPQRFDGLGLFMDGGRQLADG